MAQDELLRVIQESLSSIEYTGYEVARWLRFQNLLNLKAILESELDSGEKRLAYDNTDGNRSLRDVAIVSGVPPATIQGWWYRWSNLGIVGESPVRRGRMQQLCSLKAVGIELPKSSESSEPSKKNLESS